MSEKLNKVSLSTENETRSIPYPDGFCSPEFAPGCVFEDKVLDRQVKED
ncbi:hypothetical protein U6B65_04030 [Oscillospiraceae bacterium MB08-C2-2]|nr:hypothetical protein U6B65_04030 [Oscillospiraceae bacterium MB08-C2-2]